MTSTFFVKRK